MKVWFIRHKPTGKYIANGLYDILKMREKPTVDSMIFANCQFAPCAFASEKTAAKEMADYIAWPDSFDPHGDWYYSRMGEQKRPTRREQWVEAGVKGIVEFSGDTLEIVGPIELP